MVPRFLSAILLSTAVIGASVNGDVTPDGKPSQCILPQDQRMSNTGGTDGAGLCVFTSLEMACRFQGIPQLYGLQQWMHRNVPGGGYPQKVDTVIKEYCRVKNMPVPLYIQITNGDEETLKKALKSRRMISITYCYSPSGRYGGGRIAHMVNAVNAPLPGTKTGYWGIMDNNYVKEIEWLNDKEFQGPFLQGGGGWAVIFLGPPAPPAPHN